MVAISGWTKEGLFKKNKQWPETGDQYYTIRPDGYVAEDTFMAESKFDQHNRNVRNCFRSRKEANTKMRSIQIMAETRLQSEWYPEHWRMEPEPEPPKEDKPEISPFEPYTMCSAPPVFNDSCGDSTKPRAVRVRTFLERRKKQMETAKLLALARWSGAGS